MSDRRCAFETLTLWGQVWSWLWAAQGKHIRHRGPGSWSISAESHHTAAETSAAYPASQTTIPGWVAHISPPPLPGLGVTYPRLLTPASTTRDRNPAAFLRARPRLCRRPAWGPARVLVRRGGAFVVRDGDPNRTCHDLMVSAYMSAARLHLSGRSQRLDRSGNQLIVEKSSEP